MQTLNDLSVNFIYINWVGQREHYLNDQNTLTQLQQLHNSLYNLLLSSPWNYATNKLSSVQQIRHLNVSDSNSEQAN